MPEIALVGASCDATGHPPSCTEPAPGSVQPLTAMSVSVNGTQVYADNSAQIVVQDHAHSYTDIDSDDAAECTDIQQHAVDPTDTHSISYNGSPVYLVDDTVPDPVSGGTITVQQNPQSHSVKLSK